MGSIWAAAWFEVGKPDTETSQSLTPKTNQPTHKAGGRMPATFKKKPGGAKGPTVEAKDTAVPATTAVPASLPVSPPAPGPTGIKAQEEEEEDAPVLEWVALKLKVVGWGYTDAEVTLPTSTTTHELRRLLEERHGPFTELAVALDAAPGHPGHTLLLDTRAGASTQPAPSATLAECGVWGRRHRRRADAEGAAKPVVRFVYCLFTQGQLDPLLRYDAGP